MTHSLLHSWFLWIARHPRRVTLFSLLALVLLAVPLRELHKDTSADAFVDPANPARLYRERVEAQFGVTDPMVIAVVRDAPGGIYEPATLALIRALSSRVSALPGVDPDRTLSLATQSYVSSVDDGIRIERFLDDGPISSARADWVRRAVADSPLHQGALVAGRGNAALIVAQVLDEKRASQTYRDVLALVEAAERPAGVSIHVAGEGAITGYLSDYIDGDARRMIPIAVLVIALVLFATFRTWRATWVALVIVLGAVTGTLGLMAACGVSYFAITSGLVAALVGISVADSIHVFAEYYERALRDPTQPHAARVAATMADMARPITLTSITTVAGFATQWFTNTMPPIRWFGVFGAIGVTLAWLYTVTLLPALLAWLPARQSPVIERRVQRLLARGGTLADAPSVSWVMALGRAVLRAPRTTLLLAVIVSVAGVLGLSRLTIDYARVDNFNANSPLHVADEQLNARFAGGYHLDVVVEAAGTDGILQPAVLQQIAALQRFAQSLPGVGGSLSVADYLRQLNRAAVGGTAGEGGPESATAAAQLLLLYGASANPADLEQVIDSARRQALVRIFVRTPRWSEHARVVHDLQHFVDSQFNRPGLRASLTGRVMVDHVWMQGIADSHFASVGVSIVAVFLMCVALFRSLRSGLLCLVPVAVGVLAVYAVMGFGDVWLGVATSMFASVAIGLGVDFAIHAIDRAEAARAQWPDEPGTDPAGYLLGIFRDSGRPLLCNALVIALGFGSVMLSGVPPVRQFGLLVAVGITASFIASLTVLPALLALFARRRTARLRSARTLVHVPSQFRGDGPSPLYAWPLLALAAAAALAGASAPARAAAALSADEIMARVQARPDADHLSETVDIELTDRRGGRRLEQTRVFRRRLADQRQTALFYAAPLNVRGTAFLTFDYSAADRADDQWLYLPALRKVRRVPAAERGDAFLGTDLSYDEIRNDNKVPPDDWRFQRLPDEVVGGVACVVVEGRPANEKIARELRLSRAIWRIDPEVWMSRQADFWDQNGNPLKTVTTAAIERISGLWLATRIDVQQHKTGHRTSLRISDIDTRTPLDPQWFTQERLVRGL